MAVKAAIDWDVVFDTSHGYILSLLLDKSTTKTTDGLGNVIVSGDELKNPLTVPKQLIDSWRKQEWL